MGAVIAYFHTIASTLKCNPSSMQEHSTESIFSTHSIECEVSVFPVTCDRMTHLSGMNANLMRSTSADSGSNQGMF